MAKKIKLKLKKGGKGFYQQITRPLEEAHGDTVEFVGKMKNPPKALKDLGVWPDLGGKR